MKKLLLALAAAMSLAAQAGPIVLQTQGSFAVGGNWVEQPGVFSEKNFLSGAGQRAYGDHAYVFYQIPENARPLPLIFQHGGAQSKRTWESGPDGRDGFQNIFLRKRYPVYLVDQPRSGEASLSTKPVTSETPWVANPMYGDHTLFMLSRVGTFAGGKARVYDGSQFPADEASIEQFQRGWTVGSGPLDNDLNADALVKLAEKTGPSILVTHSMGGTIGWRAALRSRNIRAIVALEPGGTPFLFPSDSMPEPVKSAFPALAASAKAVAPEQFAALTRIPILILYGDFIAKRLSKNVGQDKWRTEQEMAGQFVRRINARGGDATLVKLPDIGIRGNSHFLMQERNNGEIADLIDKWLRSKGLAGR